MWRGDPQVGATREHTGGEPRFSSPGLQLLEVLSPSQHRCLQRSWNSAGWAGAPLGLARWTEAVSRRQQVRWARPPQVSPPLGGRLPWLQCDRSHGLHTETHLLSLFWSF